MLLPLTQTMYDPLTTLISSTNRSLCLTSVCLAIARGSECSLSMSGATNILILHQLVLGAGWWRGRDNYHTRHHVEISGDRRAAAAAARARGLAPKLPRRHHATSPSIYRATAPAPAAGGSTRHHGDGCGNTAATAARAWGHRTLPHRQDIRWNITTD